MGFIHGRSGLELKECGHDKATQQSNSLVMLLCSLLNLARVDPFSHLLQSRLFKVKIAAGFGS